MLPKVVVAAVLAAGALFAASPASAVPIDRGIAAKAGGPQATQVAWVCNRRGRCRWVVGPRVWVAPPVWGVPVWGPRWVGPGWGRGWYGPRRGWYGRGWRGGYRGGWRGGRRW
jgi:hypothetical protein